MQTYLKLFLILLLLLPSLACGRITTDTINGSGKLETQEFDVSNFDRVMLAGFGDVFLQQGDMEALTVQTDDNILPLLDIRVVNGELRLGTKPNLSINPSQSITYNVTVKDLNKIALNGSGNFHVENIRSKDMGISVNGSGDIEMKELDSSSLSIDVSGSGNITIHNVSTQKVDTNVKGSGTVKLDGTADSQKVYMSGSGNYLADDLETGSADIQVPGSANLTVWVQDELTVNMSGSGDVRYYGKPSVDQSVSGSGNISSLGEK